MLPTVDFDDKHRLQANEICDVGTDRNLPTELMTIELAQAKVPPKGAFRVRHALS